MNRRQFLHALSAYGLLSQIPEFALAGIQSENETLAICLNSMDDADLDKGASAIPGKLLLINSRTMKTELIDIPFLGHSPIQNPVRPSQLLISLKWGKVAAEVDLEKKKLIRVITAENLRRFFGHGAFSPDGESYFFTEFDDQKKISFLGERSSKDHKLIRLMPTFGSYAHEVHFDKAGEKIFVMNAGRSGRRKNTSQLQANFSTIDYKSGKLLQQTLFPLGEVPSHFTRFENGSVLALGGNIVGPSYVGHIDPAGSLNQLPLPREKIFGQAFEAIKEGNYTWISFPNARAMVRWDMKKNSAAEVVQTDSIPRGMKRLSSNGLWLATSNGIEVHQFDAIRKVSELKTPLHLFNHFGILKSVSV